MTSTPRSFGLRRPPWRSALVDRGPSRSGRCPTPAARQASARSPAIDAPAIGRIFREESGRCVATLIRVFGDIDVAEDAVQDAFAVALRKWPIHGLPPNPGGWITTTARRCAIDRLRRESRGRDLLDEVAVLASSTEDPGLEVMGNVQDDRLRLIFTCCRPGTFHGSAGGAHPALARWVDDGGSRLRLPGHRGDHVSAPRARQAQDQGGADPVPRAGGSGAARSACAPVLAVVYLVYNAGLDQPGAESARCTEAIRLARIALRDADAGRARGGRPAWRCCC